jgi:hypothetical protein
LLSSRASAPATCLQTGHHLVKRSNAIPVQDGAR